MRRVGWTPASRSDLAQIDDWLTNEADPHFAVRTLATIRYRANFLIDFPRGGRPYRGNTRILRVLDTPYLIHYRIVGDLEVEVLRVYHERENWQVEL
jgi:plasmid stabilization system protein ParE